jgi:hypothetical protein
MLRIPPAGSVRHNVGIPTLVERRQLRAGNRKGSLPDPPNLDRVNPILALVTRLRSPLSSLSQRYIGERP